MELRDFEQYKSANPTRKPNRILIPVTRFSFDDEGMYEFNEIYHYCLENTKNGNFKEFEIAPSGSIRTAIGTNRGARWQLVIGKTFVEIVIKNLDARYYKFQIGNRKQSDGGLYGRQAFTIYKNELLKTGVDLEELAIDPIEGEEIKATIPNPKIDLMVAADRTYENVFHIDLNSAFNAGMMKAFPVIEPAVRNMYNKRHLDEKFKDVLNMTQGFMQSSLVQFKYAHISKAGYVWTNNKIEELSLKLKQNGYRILAYNTDGIWCQSFTDEVYHDDEEGNDIGQWKIDWINCKVRFRSKGAYEVEGYKVKRNGEKLYTYKPILRGTSSYEKIKPRDEWEWGDIYKGSLNSYTFKEGIGVVKNADY